MNTIPERVAWLRDAAELSKRGLSKLAGLDPSHVRLLEDSTGQRTSRRTAESLAGVFDVELAWLMLGVGPIIAAHPELDPADPADLAAITAHVSAAVERARAAAQVADAPLATGTEG